MKTSEAKQQQEPGGGLSSSEARVLFPDVEVCGRKIRPWTLGQIVDLSPVLVEVGRILEQEAVTVDTLFQNWLKYLPRFLPFSVQIITVSTGMSEEEARDLMMDEAGLIITTIISQNWDYLKNSLGLGQAALARKKAV